MAGVIKGSLTDEQIERLIKRDCNLARAAASERWPSWDAWVWIGAELWDVYPNSLRVFLERRKIATRSANKPKIAPVTRKAVRGDWDAARERARAEVRAGLRSATAAPSRREWNRELAAQGLAAYRLPDATDAQWDHALRQRHGVAGAEKRIIKDHFGVGENLGRGEYLVRSLPVPAKGKRRNKAKATRVSTAGGDDFTYARIGNDAEAVEEWLTRVGQHALDEYRGCFKRGRPSATRVATKAELAERVHELREMGANLEPISIVLVCDTDTVRVLLKQRES